MDTKRETDLGVFANVILFGMVTVLEWFWYDLVGRWLLQWLCALRTMQFVLSREKSVCHRIWMHFSVSVFRETQAWFDEFRFTSNSSVWCVEPENDVIWDETDNSMKIFRIRISSQKTIKNEICSHYQTFSLPPCGKIPFVSETCKERDSNRNLKKD